MPPTISLRAPIRRLGVVLLLGAATVLAGCNPEPAAPVGPGQTQGIPGGGGGGGGGGAQANVISGRVTTESGAPVGGARLRIVGYTGGASLGQDIETVETGPDGTYSYPVPDGLYEVLGEGPLEFDGRTYLYSLDPVDGSCEQQLSADGIVKDFVLRLTGLMMCYDGVDPDNYQYYHGAAVQLQGQFPSFGGESVVEYILTPDGPFADGTPGQDVVLQRTVAAHSTSFGPLEQTWILHDIPLARYTVSASVVTADGTRTPLLVSTDAQPEPGISAPLTFDPRVIVGEPAIGYTMPTLTVSEGPG